MKERREFPRLNQSVRMVVQPVDEAVPGSALSALALNISGGGICFPSAHAFAPGSMLALEIDLEGFPAGVIAMAKVAWSEENDRSDEPPYLVGAEFHWVGWDSNTAQESIASFLRNKLASAAA